MTAGGFKRLGDILEDARDLPPQGAPMSKAGSDTPPANLRGIPAARGGDTFDNFDLGLNPRMESALRRCKAVAVGEAWCAFLAGEFGTGKTHLAIAALNEWMAAGKGTYFWKVPDFLDWLRRQTFDERGLGLEYAVQSYRLGLSLVCFDDLGTENPTDWAHEQMYRVLDSRYDGRLPTIITTNQPLDRIDGRVQSRFVGGLVVCEGRDVRRRKGGEQ